MTIERGRHAWRVYRADDPRPTTWNALRSFGPIMTARFDHHESPPHDDPELGILYGAMSIVGALVEAFQDSRVVDWTRGGWPTRAGASQAISSRRGDVARAWSRAICTAYPSIQALTHPGLLDPIARIAARHGYGMR
jgi:hypothetical protein